jgi:hypothetical protein
MHIRTTFQCPIVSGPFHSWFHRQQVDIQLGSMSFGRLVSGNSIPPCWISLSHTNKRDIYGTCIVLMLPRKVQPTDPPFYRHISISYLGLLNQLAVISCSALTSDSSRPRGGELFSRLPCPRFTSRRSCTLCCSRDHRSPARCLLGPLMNEDLNQKDRQK